MPVSVHGSKSLQRKLDALGEVAKGRMLERALTVGALVVQNDAKRRARYLSGNLRRSIHIGGHEDLNPEGGNILNRTGDAVPSPEIGVDSVAVYTGTDVIYAAVHEFGNESTSAQPYMRPAADENHSEVRSEIGEALRDLIKAAAR